MFFFPPIETTLEPVRLHSPSSQFCWWFQGESFFPLSSVRSFSMEDCAEVEIQHNLKVL